MSVSPSPALARADEHQAALETLALLEAVQSAAPIGLGFADREGRYVRVNERLAEMNGRPVEAHLGRHIGEVVPAYWPAIEPLYRRVLETGVPVSHRAVTAMPEAGPTRLQISYYPVRVAGELVGVGFVVVDITESTAAEAFRAAVMDHMAEGLCTTDSEGRVNSVNRAAAELLGWSPEELLGRPLHDVVHSAQDENGHSAPDCPLALPGAEGEPGGDSEDRYVRKDGTVLEVAHSVTRLHVGAATAGVVVVFRDITQLKEQQRRQVEGSHDQKLEALGRLSAGLAHEINTPIQFVGDNTRFLAEAYQTMLELLLVYRECMGLSSGQLSWDERKKRAEEAEEKADIEYLAEEVPGAVEQSLEGIDRVASLVRAMKAFSYKDTKEHSYADLNEGIRTTVIVARNEVKYVADVVLELGELPDVLCNLGDLNQVFLNLLVNAADAMPEGGKRGEIKVGTRVDGTNVVISFADNGTGIPEEIRKTIFDPFFTTKEVGKGTGQGLALARAVCEKHGGTIEVNSELGVGTEFVLTLPISGKRGGPA
jgi:two-component system, NtrC family, sensor kinase